MGAWTSNIQRNKVGQQKPTCFGYIYDATTIDRRATFLRRPKSRGGRIAVASQYIKSLHDAVVKTTIRLRFYVPLLTNSQSKVIKVTLTYPASRSHADLFILLMPHAAAAATRAQVGLGS